ncbi:MAG: CHAD domain-containing protein [Propionibacteriaceae bacterium]
MPEFRERELKFDVEGSWVLPDFSSFVPGRGRLEAVTEELDAEYYDTEDEVLRRLRITLRRRSGGHDAGWHLKLPAGDARTEVRSQSRRRTVPRELTSRINGLLGGRALRPVARVQTVRRLQRLRDVDDDIVLEIADDQVEGTAYERLAEAAAADSTPRVERWREVEVEVGPAGNEDSLAVVATALTDAGAQRSVHPSKLTRLIGRPLPRAEVGPLADLVAAFVADQCAAIVMGDVALRAELDEQEVHDVRVAVRRLRSVLRTFGDVVVGDPTALDEDLRWYANLLGEIRDGDVLRARFAAEIAALPAADVVGPVEEELHAVLTERRVQAVTRWERARRTARYRRVLGTVGSWFDAVPLVPGVAELTVDDGLKVLRKAERTADKRLAVAENSARRLHRARKAAKRLRYTADLLAPAWPAARKTAKRAKKRQTLLGHHQDEIVAVDFLRELGTQVGATPGHNGFTWGLLTARAEQRAQEIRRDARRL